jgi:ribosomal protein S18 acetylase RimI-like enzyme
MAVDTNTLSAWNAYLTVIILAQIQPIIQWRHSNRILLMSTAKLQLTRSMRFPRVLITLDTISENAAMVASCILWAVIFWLDWHCWPRVPFGAYYLIPIVLAAWRLPVYFTGFLILATSIARTTVMSRLFLSHPILYYAADVASFTCIYAGAAYLLSHLKQVYRMLADEAQVLATKVEQGERRSWLDASIRRAVSDDVERIVQLVTLGGEDGDLSKDLTHVDRQAMLRSLYADILRLGVGPRTTWTGPKAVVPVEFWVSQINGEIAGFFMVMGLDDKGGPERELHTIVTAADFRGSGVATAMVNFFCSHYYGRKLYAAVMPQGTMHHMLKRRGFFHHVDTQEGYSIL